MLMDVWTAYRGRRLLSTPTPTSQYKLTMEQMVTWDGYQRELGGAFI